MPASPHRIVARYLKKAYEFDSPEALKWYLQQHPDADKSKHTVKKPEKKDAPAEKEQGGKDQGGHDEHEEKPKKSWKERLKGLKDSTVEFIKKAPEKVKQFVQDDQFRRDTLVAAHKAVESLPKTVVNRVIETAKHEVKEYKEAASGIKAVLKGGKMDEHQKKALKTVALHVGVGLAAAALTSSGIGIPAAFAKGLGKHIAYKAATKAVGGHLALLEELGHIGHGIKHIMEHTAAEEKEADPDTVLANMMALAIAKEIKGMDEAGLTEALNAVAEDE